MIKGQLLLFEENPDDASTWFVSQLQADVLLRSPRSQEGRLLLDVTHDLVAGNDDVSPRIVNLRSGNSHVGSLYLPEFLCKLSDEDVLDRLLTPRGVPRMLRTGSLLIQLGHGMQEFIPSSFARGR